MNVRPSTTDDTLRREVYDLADALLDRTISDEDSASLARLVAENSAARKHYVRFMHDSALLGEWGRDSSGEKLAGAEIDTDDLPVNLDPQTASFTLPSLSTNHHPLPTAFVGGPVFSYMVASVVLCLMLLSAWAYKITLTEQSTPNMASSQFNQESPMPALVGKITGMKDCRWKGDSPGTIVGASVPIGRKYALDAGLLEITYTSGAKVILESPCVYEVDSDASGRLQLGKLVARVEKNDELGIRNKESERWHPDIHHSSFITHNLFSVRTPTATVTDLGTEFGVEVNINGGTTSHVFQGSVRVEAVGENLPSPTGSGVGGEGRVVQLGAGESARVGGLDKPLVTVLGPSDKVANFIREIPKRTINTFDLVDVVAGGDGFSGKRGRGINFNTARIVDSLKFGGQRAHGPTDDGKFHLVKDIPFVDGIVTPQVGDTRVQVDSAGHEFSGFGITEVRGGDHIWAGGAMGNPRYPTVVCGVDYASLPHGYLFLSSNIAITFDLEAIRRANPGRKLLSFRAVAANVGDPKTIVQRPYESDIWVLVDGQSRFQQRQEHSEWKYNGEQRVSVPIGNTDRFLTLAATDAGDGISHDWVIFGDPILEMIPVEEGTMRDGLGVNGIENTD